MVLDVNDLVLKVIYYGILFVVFVGVPSLLIFNCIKVFKSPEYNKLDKISSIFHIFTITFYIPMSLFSVMQLISNVNIQTTLQEILWNIWCYLGISIPVISIVNIVFSFILRKNKKSWLGLTIQFVPLAFFALYYTLACILQYMG